MKCLSGVVLQTFCFLDTGQLVSLFDFCRQFERTADKGRLVILKANDDERQVNEPSFNLLA